MRTFYSHQVHSEILDSSESLIQKELNGFLMIQKMTLMKTQRCF
jgi:hypothetical protein